MTDKFVVPEPSHGAITAAYKAWQECPSGGEPWKAMLRRGYEWDVERIVRAEVERFREWQQSVALNGVVQEEDERAYLAARFGEGEPEKWSTKHEHQWTTLGGGNPAVLCGACGAFKDQAPSAPAVRIDGVLLDTARRVVETV